ncbi:MAG TPA: hypothetical protein VK308_00415 [Pyrinomonadaceae bacterium]|nr:hypothetical protein [Pyrinomonadaceae bacterium]
MNYPDGGLKNQRRKTAMYSEFHCATTVVDSIVTRFNLPQKSDLHYCFAFTAQSTVVADRWREAFYKNIAGSVNALGGRIVGIYGTNQTVNIRVVLPPTAAPDCFARRLKILSASWARRKAACPNFAWREDYEAITLDSFKQPRKVNVRAMRANA